MTNKYSLPFSSFVGITGHAQTSLFGCAFLHDETTKTSNGCLKHPKTIITDQDKAMKLAIEEVWQIQDIKIASFTLNKCYSKNIKVFASNDVLYKELENIVNNSVTEEEFEYLWSKMIEEKGL